MKDLLFINEGRVIPEAALAGGGAGLTRGWRRVVHRLASGGLMVCQGSDGASHEHVVDSIPAVDSSFGLDIPGRRTI